ncbi:hypothetical protein IGI67_003368 [Enterococcus sp. AZ196]
MLSILEACRCLNVSRAGYYLFCQREPSNLEIENETLAELLKEIFLEHKGRYGARRIKFVLQKEYQLAISRRRITRLLHTQGLYTRGVRRKYRRQKTGCCSVQKNLVYQNFSVKSPHTVWFGYIPTVEGTLYLSTYMDAYSRRVVSYRIDNHMRDELGVESLETALFKEKPKAGLVIHVDQGSQYISHLFLK